MQTAETIRKALRGVRDPELNLNIIDLGLVYEITVSDEGDVHVQMTLTSPGCPVGPRSPRMFTTPPTIWKASIRSK